MSRLRIGAAVTEGGAASVVVGIDGTDNSSVAVEFAIAEAAFRDFPVTVVQTVDLRASPRRASRIRHILQPSRGDVDLLGEVADWARRNHPGVAVRIGLAHDLARAALIVAGHREGSDIAETADAGCPLIVARRDQLAGLAAPVVVGVDWSVASHRAVEFAFDEATLRGVPLLAIHAQPDIIDADPLGDAMAHMFRRLTRRFPRVDLHYATVPGASAIEVLRFASTAAGLVVIGSRGLGALRGRLLGSVSRALIHSAHCPVAIVRSGDRLPANAGDYARALVAAHVPPIG